MKWMQNIKIGLLLGVSIAVGTQLLTWLGLGLTNWFVLLTYVLVALFVIHALKKVWKEKRDKLSFWEALVIVLTLVIVSRYVFQFYMFLYTAYFNPTWVSEVSEYWTQMLVEQGTAKDSIDAQIEAFQKAYQPLNMFTIEIIKYGLSQIVLGLLISVYFLFRKPK